MPRALVVGNGNLLATFDKYLQMRDFYYPHVGMEDHTGYQNIHRIGFFVDGKFSWINDGTWEITIKYAKDTLVGDSYALNRTLGLSVHFEDFVYTTHDILFRKVTIENLNTYDREIRIFFHHDFHIYGDKSKDTAQFEPDLNGMVHYRQSRYFLITGKWETGGGIDQYSAGKSNYMGKEGTFRDAEDGMLTENPIEQGSVDSTVRFSHHLKAGEKQSLFFWIVAAKKYEEMCERNERVWRMGAQKIMDHTTEYWRKWVNKEHFHFEGILPDGVIDMFKRSLLIIRTQIDNGGAIIAANDSDIMKFNKDTYSYMWPRDGAMVSMALTGAGYEELSRRFFFFCQSILTKDGYFLHKYNPDGSVGSSWHPKIVKGERQLPMQEDEAALVLIALERYYEKFRAIEVVQNLFNGLVLKVGRWMLLYTDEKTGLPHPSYDLWEEHRDVFSYTSACAYAGLMAASRLSEETGHLADAKQFSDGAIRLQEAVLKHLYSEEHNRFLKRVSLKNGEIIKPDSTVDASLFFLWRMGILSAEDPRMKSTVAAIIDKLHVSAPIGGIARYENDVYQFDWDHMKQGSVPGNPWIITTLWLADYEIETAKSKEDLDVPLGRILWACDRANIAGILPEQVQPITGEHLSVAPLTWSHAGFVCTILRYLTKWRTFSK